MTDTPTPEMASDENIETLRSLPGAGEGRAIARIVARLDYEIAERKKVEHERDLERRALRVVIEMEDFESGTEGDFMWFAAYGDLYDEVRAIRAALMRETESRDSRDAN